MKKVNNDDGLQRLVNDTSIILFNLDINNNEEVIIKSIVEPESS